MSDCQDRPTFLPEAVWKALMNLPALRYMKAPVNTETELYQKYPIGNEKGTFAFVHNDNTFYTYHPKGILRGRWKPISADGISSFFEIDAEFLKDGDILIYDSSKEKFVVKSGNIWNKLIDKASSAIQVNRFLNEVEVIPTIESDAGIYFIHKNNVENGKVIEFRALYIVLDTFLAKKVVKIWNSSDYYTANEVQDKLDEKANQTQVDDIAASVDVLAVTKAEKSVVDALQNGIIRQIAVSTYNTGSNSLSSVYGLTANSNGSNGKAKQNGWDVLVIADETKGGKSNRYNWNGTEWVDMLSGVYDENAQLVTYRKWLRDKTANYTKIEIGAISRIFNITIFADANHLNTDVYSLNECYVKDGFGVLSIFKNGKSYFKISEIELSNQRYTDHRVDVIYDYSIPASGNLNTANSPIILSPICIEHIPTLSEMDKTIIKSRLWLKNKDTEYLQNEASAIKRVLDIKVFVVEKIETDVYAINIVRSLDDQFDQLAIFKNGTSAITIAVPKGRKGRHTYQNLSATLRVELELDMSLGTIDLNSTVSNVILSDDSIDTYLSYLKSISFIPTKILRASATGVAYQADGYWTDGSGAWKGLDYNSTWQAYDGEQISHADTYKVLVQPKVTRDLATGGVVDIPEKTINNL